MDRFVTDSLNGWNFEDEHGNPMSHEDLLKQEPLPPEPTQGDYSQVPPTTGEEFGAQRRSGPATLLTQAAARGEYPDASRLDRFVNAIMPYQITPLGETVHTEMLSAVDANEAFAPKGEDWFSKPISFGLAKITADQRRANLQRDADLERYSNVHSWPINFGVNAAGFMLDPLNVGASLVPGIGEEAVAARLGGGVGARMAGRAVAGATGGAAAMVPSVGVHMALDDNYSLREAFFDLAMGAAGGAVFQGIIPGTLRETGVLLKPDKLMSEASRRTLADGLTRDAAALGQTAQQTHTAIQTAVGQIVDERPVDVTPVVHPPANDLQVANVRRYIQHMLPPEQRGVPENIILKAAAIARTGEDIGFALREAEKVEIPSTLAQVAERQKYLVDNGYAPGLSHEEFIKAKEEIDAAARPESAESAAARPEPGTTSETGAPAGETKAEGEVAPPPELRLGEMPTPVTEDETSLFKAIVKVNGEDKLVRAVWEPQKIAEALREAGVDPEIAEAQGGLVQAQAQEAAYSQAAQCLVEAGI